ncbi:carbohydrate ABC transporter permease [Streptomyces sp. SL13]|uniref:Carbohydrate ABC transporter permease n=1 Tax=Streptantibioticus silvisoli TaxID=2705255 RepID=A0AA90H7H0_9ACTN|nr:carbohydrate ABC transporter permease [Streptantibioticus silvisoli]MDI5972385.1 carbohydrate ABC transporter permease [Streptantibioticus silvisoli]
MSTVTAPTATAAPAPARPRRRADGARIITVVAALLVALFVALPLYWMVATAFKSTGDVAADPPQYFPTHPTTANFGSAFHQYNFGRYIENSAVVSVIATLLVLGFGIFAAYALARLPVRGKAGVMMTLLMISLFPTVALAAPLYLLMRDIGWLNSYQGLILAYTALNLPFAIWILRNYFLAIPKEMEEVAWMDGASPVRTVVSIILPQAKPGIFTAGIFAFVACWTEFLIALTLDNDDAHRTIPVGIALFGGQFTTPYGTIFAASAVAMLPIAILVLVFRKAVVSGLTAGAVKG